MARKPADTDCRSGSSLEVVVEVEIELVVEVEVLVVVALLYRLTCLADCANDPFVVALLE